MSEIGKSGLGEISLSYQMYNPDIYRPALNSRIDAALKSGTTSFPIFRTFGFAVAVEIEHFFDDLALNLGCNAHRLSKARLLLEGPGLLAHAEGSRKSDYASCEFRIWADSVEKAETLKSAIFAKADCSLIEDSMVSISWAFANARGDLNISYIEETIEDKLHNEAYPDLNGGVLQFVQDYLDSDETILVLQGKPGTGKTRLIRAILGAMTKRKGDKISALYTGDKNALEAEEIYVNFVTGNDDAFVIEDADYILTPRADGNDHLHRFLTIADGVVRSQGRKIIFSTNLPNIGDLDDALIRPGRCFARLFLRELTKREAELLLVRLCNGDTDMAAQALECVQGTDRGGYTVADIYRAHGNSKVTETSAKQTVETDA